MSSPTRRIRTQRTVIIVCATRRQKHKVKEFLEQPIAKSLIKRHAFTASVIVRESPSHGSPVPEAQEVWVATTGLGTCGSISYGSEFLENPREAVDVTIGGIISMDGRLFGLTTAPDDDPDDMLSDWKGALWPTGPSSAPERQQPTLLHSSKAPRITSPESSEKGGARRLIDAIFPWSLRGKVFKVLRVMLDQPLSVEGDSGSWAFVDGPLCGVVIAGGGGADEILKEPRHKGLAAKGWLEPPSSSPTSWSGFDRSYKSRRPSDCEILADPEAYIIPIEGVFGSIRGALSSIVSLPTLQDWQLHTLRRSRELWPGNLAHMLAEWLEPYLELEYLLADEKARPAPAESHAQQPMPTPCAPLMSPLDSISRFTLEDLAGLSAGTIDSVLLLGAVYLLSPSF
ncbi:hypothetical protein B0T18DRAFT_390233 [Schizothecium vesticola]|uniref:Uncharacterized protein n=1 Tax=Schizothecium vesticola TaxID=314040 RepID=A0AA40EU93_9PEZI|nr:hypothetical protein B0T18DRAFT_390233 [Schizothecium vesticola]